MAALIIIKPQTAPNYFEKKRKKICGMTYLFPPKSFNDCLPAALQNLNYSFRLHIGCVEREDSVYPNISIYMATGDLQIAIKNNVYV